MIVKSETNITNNKVKDAGITMIALVVTIVVLLILASITIGAVTSENGILRNANDAKEQTEIAEEKEIVDRATIQAMGNNKRGNIVEDELQEQLDKITGNGKTEADDVGEEFEVAFIESKRYYTVDKDGMITGPQETVEDKSPGDITKDENGDDIEEGQPYEIWCIEDLCAFSNEVNSGNVFSNKTIMLMRDLNFNSKYSYVSGNITVDGNIPSCNSIEELQKSLTENEEFYPIGDGEKGNAIFQGTFDGQGNTIKNIYENTTGYIGLFGICAGNTIKNVNITGYMETSIDTYAGGLISYASHVTNVETINCVSSITIVANNASVAGGIIGRGGTNNIQNCCNNGNITANSGSAGGIIGYTNTTNIDSCYNTGNITGDNVGGILGYSYYSRPLSIINSYNSGTLNGTNAAGIVGTQNGVNSSIEIKNTYNIGNVKGKNVTGIANTTVAIPTIENCYNAGNLKGSNIQAAIIGYTRGNGIEEGKILHCFFINNTEYACIYNLLINNSTSMTKEEMKSQNFVDELNKYVENNLDNTKDFKYWKLEENRYPIFE